MVRSLHLLADLAECNWRLMDPVSAKLVAAFDVKTCNLMVAKGG